MSLFPVKQPRTPPARTWYTGCFIKIRYSVPLNLNWHFPYVYYKSPVEMAMDYSAKEAANFAEDSLGHWTNFKMTLHVEITALKIHRYNYENKKISLCLVFSWASALHNKIKLLCLQGALFHCSCLGTEKWFSFREMLRPRVWFIRIRVLSLINLESSLELLAF